MVVQSGKNHHAANNIRLYDFIDLNNAKNMTRGRLRYSFQNTASPNADPNAVSPSTTWTSPQPTSQIQGSNNSHVQSSRSKTYPTNTWTKTTQVFPESCRKMKQILRHKSNQGSSKFRGWCADALSSSWVRPSVDPKGPPLY